MANPDTKLSPLETAAQHFKAIPWCAKLLSAPDVIPFIPTSRLEGDVAARSRTRDQLFRKTLNREDAVPQCIGFYKDTPATASQEEEQSRLAASTVASDGKSLLINSVSLLFDLRPGVNGFNGTAQGGFVACLVDEAMGSIFLVNNIAQVWHEVSNGALPPNVLRLTDLRVFTATMDVHFRKPIQTPATVLVTARFIKSEGRKIFMDVRVTGEDDREYALCDSLWLSLPLEKL